MQYIADHLLLESRIECEEEDLKPISGGPASGVNINAPMAYFCKEAWTDTCPQWMPEYAL